MKRTIIALSIGLVSILSTAASINNNSVNPNQDSISVSPSSVKQGQTVFVKIITNKVFKNPYITFRGQNYKLFNSSNTYQGIIGIEATDKPGIYKLALNDETGKLKYDKAINITSGKFPIQNIVISGGKGGLTATKYELDKIQNAKLIISDYLYREKQPFDSPTKGCIISVYGLSRYHNGKPTGDYHKGVDIKAPYGRNINSITGGKVLIAEQFRLNGGTVAIDHGQGLLSFYLHMSKISVKPGEIVKPNQEIGEIGSTGFSTGPHLHWGIYVNGIPVDPMTDWIKPVPKC